MNVPPPYTPGFTNAPRPTDSQAVLSCVLGCISLFCCGVFGIVTAIPAILIGVSSRREIRRSGGALGGEGAALAGIITGGLSVVVSVGGILVYVAMFVVAMKSSSTPVAPYVPPTPIPFVADAGIGPVPKVAPFGNIESGPDAGPTVRSNVSGIESVTVHAGTGTLVEQLKAELKAAKTKKKTLLVETVGGDCAACVEIDGAIASPLVANVLGDVVLVRVDRDEWKRELGDLGMSEKTAPWFYLLADGPKVKDRVSADEWDENVPRNVAPVLGAFVQGTLKKRRAPTTSTDL